MLCVNTDRIEIAQGENLGGNRRRRLQEAADQRLLVTQALAQGAATIGHDVFHKVLLASAAPSAIAASFA